MIWWNKRVESPQNFLSGVIPRSTITRHHIPPPFVGPFRHPVVGLTSSFLFLFFFLFLIFFSHACSCLLHTKFYNTFRNNWINKLLLILISIQYCTEFILLPFSLSYNLSHYSDVKFLFKYLCAYKLFMFLLLLLWQADMSVGFGNTHSQHKTVWGHHQDWLEKLQKSKIIFFIKKQSTFCEAPTKPHRFNQSVPRVSNVFHVLISTRHYPTRTLFSFSLFGVSLSHCVCVTLPQKIILCIR